MEALICPIVIAIPATLDFHSIEQFAIYMFSLLLKLIEAQPMKSNTDKRQKKYQKGLRVVIPQRVLKNNVTAKLWNSFITTSLSCANALMLITLCGTQEISLRHKDKKEDMNTTGTNNIKDILHAYFKDGSVHCKV